MELWKKYIKQVSGGEILVNIHIKNAIKRHLSDLEKSKTEDFAYYFDERLANLYCKAIRMIPHTSGEMAGKPFNLEAWQAFIVAMIFGWRNKSNDLVRFKKTYIEVPRKNGKTEFLAALGTIDLIFSKTIRSERYWAATTEKQASIGYDRQVAMVNDISERSKEIAKRYKVFKTGKRLFDKQSKSFISVVASDSKRLDGLLVHKGYIDELHAHPDGSVVSILETGMGAFDDSQSFIITTAGYNTASYCKDVRDRYVKVVSGDLVNDTIFAMVYGLDEGDDWNDERMWQKANPSLGGALKWSYMRSQYLKVLTEGATSMISFLVKNLNQWTNQKVAWISNGKWKESNKAINIQMSDLIGQKCVVGLDLSSVSDITAAAFVFPLPNEEYAIKMRYFIPEDTVWERTKKDHVKYDVWVEKGLVTTTPGSAIDYEYVWKHLKEEMQQYEVELVNCDSWNAFNIEKLAKDDDYTEFYEVSQRIATLYFPTKEFERLVHHRRIKHFNDEVLEWMLGNVVLRKDSNGNYVIDKHKSAEKIDGLAAVINAFQAFYSEKEENVYEDRGMRIL